MGSRSSPLRSGAIVVIWALVPSVWAAAPVTDPVSNVEATKVRERLLAEGERLRAEARLPEAVKAFQELVTLEKRDLGPRHGKVAATLEILAQLQERRGNFLGASLARREAIDILTRTLGAGHWRTVDAQLRLSWTDTLGGLDSSQRQSLTESDSKAAQVSNLIRDRKGKDAIPIASHVLETRQRILGAGHVRVGDALLDLAIAHGAAGDAQKAAMMLQRALTLYEAAGVKVHPRTAFAHERLGRVALDAGQLAVADAHLRPALDIQRQVSGEDSAAYASVLMHVGRLQYRRNETDPAIASLERSLMVLRRQLGPQHLQCAEVLNLLGLCRLRTRDYPAATNLLQEAATIRRKLLGFQHPLHAQSLANLGHLYAAQGRFTEAVRQFDTVLSVYRYTVGDLHEDYLAALEHRTRAQKDGGRLIDAQHGMSFLVDRLEVKHGPGSPQVRARLDSLADIMARRLEEIRTFAGKKSPGVDADRSYDVLLDQLAELARLHERRGDRGAVRKMLQETLMLEAAIPANRRWRTVNARLELQYLDRIDRLRDEDRKRLAAAQLPVASAHGLDGPTLARSLRTARDVVAVRKELLGENALRTVEAIESLGRWHATNGDDDRAERLYQEALAVRAKLQGTSHPDYANLLESQADLYWTLGNKEAAVKLGKQAREILREAGIDPPPTANAEPRLTSDAKLPADHAGNLTRLARKFAEKGDAARAEPLFRQAIDLRREEVGEKDLRYADALNELAVFRMSLGDYARAEPAFFEVRDLRKAALGDRHSEYAAVLHNLGVLYERMGKLDEALPFLEQDVELTRSAGGVEHAHGLSSLAFLLTRRGEHARAEKLFREALAILTGAKGDKDLLTIRAQSNLGFLQALSGQYESAEPALRRALDLRREVQGVEHADYADCLADLGTLHLLRGAFAEAEPLLRESLARTRRLADVAAAAQSERQQLATVKTLRQRLDLYLSLALAAGMDPEKAYREVLAWRGGVFARRQQIVQFRDDPVLAAKVAEARTVSQRLSTLAFTNPPSGVGYSMWKKNLDQVSSRKEELEAEIAARFATLLANRPIPEMEASRLAESLPPQVALVDYLEYQHSEPVPKGKPSSPEVRLLAFVLRPGQPTRLVPLGPMRPIVDNVTAWRKDSLWNRPAPKGAQPGDTLARLVWRPLESYLVEVDTVLIAPDGALTGLPFGALPGSKASSYLLEERKLALVPVPRQLPELLAPATRVELEPSLLLVGNVDYAEAPRSFAPEKSSSSDLRTAARSAAGLRSFTPLPATRDEVFAVRDSFERHHREGWARILRAGFATEDAIRRLAPQHRWLHIATHGFFAQGEVRSALAPAGQDAGYLSRQDAAGYHPGLLSGLALSGANRPPEPNDDDGILTALEVSDLDLSGVEMAVLSACETGLGEIAGGEGVLGLQRAFHGAGVRSVVASLWSVPDEPTRVLMERFYANLWSRKMSKLEGLREAQLWMLREGRQSPSVQRGIRRVDGVPEADGRLPPYYWAAFVLSGDWR